MTLSRVLSILAVQFAGASKIYPPDDGSANTPIVVFLPSAKVPWQHYEATLESIQKTTKQSIWGAIASTEDTCDQAVLNAVLDLAASAGWSGPGNSIWLAGHEDGGTCVEALLSLDDVAGGVFLGALPSTDFEYTSAKPTLILSAELHGGAARPGRVVEWWRRHLELVEAVGTAKAELYKPVVILERLNSSNFCPGFDVDDDVEAEVVQHAATERIGSVVGAFFDGIYYEEATQRMGTYTSISRQIMDPLIKALDLEFSPEGGLDANGRSPFCEMAQYTLSGLSPEDMARLELTDQYGPRLAYDWKAGEDPEGTLMHCHNSAEALSDGTLKVKICSHAGHEGANSSGSETFRHYDGVAAGEMGCKLMSSEFLAQSLNTTAVNPYTTCAHINNDAVNSAFALMTWKQMTRWEERGRRICVDTDTETPNNIGPLWIHGTTNYTETEECLRVSGFHLKLALNESSSLAGVEYCKVMSPAFVLDYLLTGSLKPTASSSRAFLV